jgi:uncharacterized membrane-anchored protein YhcB (DUF1043 family)
MCIRIKKSIVEKINTKIIMDNTVIVIVAGIVIGIISYFLNRTMNELDKVKDNSEKNTIKISLLENNHTHLTDKFDLLYDAVRDLTQEIKNLNIQLSKKKDV